MARLQREAQRGGVSAASLVREAVAVYLATPTVGTPMPSIAGEFSSGITDTSERVDALPEWQLRQLVARVDQRNEQIRDDNARAEAANHG